MGGTMKCPYYDCCQLDQPSCTGAYYPGYCGFERDIQKSKKLIKHLEFLVKLLKKKPRARTLFMDYTISEEPNKWVIYINKTKEEK